MNTPEIDDGGPAFAYPASDGAHGWTGMSLRDWFAGQALTMIVVNDVSGRPANFRDHYCAGAYQWADAMLIARKGKA